MKRVCVIARCERDEAIFYHSSRNLLSADNANPMRIWCVRNTERIYEGTRPRYRLCENLFFFFFTPSSSTFLRSRRRRKRKGFDESPKILYDPRVILRNLSSQFSGYFPPFEIVSKRTKKIDHLLKMSDWTYVFVIIFFRIVFCFSFFFLSFSLLSSQDIFRTRSLENRKNVYTRS